MDIEKEWAEFAEEWKARGPLAADKRVCAVCLCDVDRATYDDHMQSHGYEVLVLHFSPKEAA